MVPLNRFHLNGLRALEIVGRLGTLAKAADELGISVGAVSPQIIRAERQLGHPVFHRTPHGLEPAPFGQRLLAQLEPGFLRTAQAVALAAGLDQTKLAVTTPPAFATRRRVPRMGGLQARHPDIQVRIDSTRRMVDLDLSDRDVAIRFGRGNCRG